MKRKLVFIISRGEVIRNFVYTNIISDLKKSFEVHIISVVPNKSLKDYLVAISDSFTELPDVKSPYVIRLLHEILDLAHNRYIWSEAAKVRWGMRDFEANSLMAKSVRLSKKLVARLFSNNRALSFLEFLDFRLARLNPEVHRYRRILEVVEADLVFNGSHLHGKAAYPIIQAARMLKVKTASFLFSWDNLTSQGRIIPPYNAYFSWNTHIKNDLLRIYPRIDSNDVYVTGTPQFSFHFREEFFLSRKNFMKQLNLLPTDKYIVYSAGMSHHMPYEHEVVESIADSLSTTHPDVKLVVRKYAKDRGAGFNELSAKRPDIIIPEVNWEKKYSTPLIDDQYFYTNLLRHCELGINVASTVSLELCMLDKPAINIAFDPPNRDIKPYSYKRFYSFDHYKPIVDSGAITVVETEIELMEAITQYLKNTSWKKSERRNLTNDFFEVELGEGSKEKIISNITDLLL